MKTPFNAHNLAVDPVLQRSILKYSVGKDGGSVPSLGIKVDCLSYSIYGTTVLN